MYRTLFTCRFKRTPGRPTPGRPMPDTGRSTPRQRGAHRGAAPGLAQVIFLALVMAGCGRHGFDEGGVFSAAPVSETSALVGCSIDIRSDGPDSYAVMWHEHPTPGSDLHTLVFARFDTSGTLTAGPEVVDTISSQVKKIWLHLGENNSYQAFFRENSTSTTRSLRLDRDGRLVSVEDLFSHPDGAFLVRNDAGFSLFFEEGAHLHMGTISATGKLESEPVDVDIPVATDEDGKNKMEHPRGVRTDTGIHIVFEHSWGESVGYARLDAAGKYLDGRIEDFGAHRSPSIASDGMGNLMLTWYDSEQLTEFALTESGDPLWAGVRQDVAMNRRESPTMAMTGGDGRIAMVWESDADTVLPQVLFRSVEVDVAAAVTPEPLGTPGHAHSCPSIARGDGHFGIAYRGEIDGEQRLFVGIRHD